MRSCPPEKNPFAAWSFLVSLMASNSSGVVPEASIRARTTDMMWS